MDIREDSSSLEINRERMARFRAFSSTTSTKKEKKDCYNNKKERRTTARGIEKRERAPESKRITISLFASLSLFSPSDIFSPFSSPRDDDDDRYVGSPPYLSLSLFRSSFFLFLSPFSSLFSPFFLSLPLRLNRIRQVRMTGYPLFSPFLHLH